MKSARIATPVFASLALLLLLLIPSAVCAGPVVYLDANGNLTAIDNPAAVDALSALKALAGGPQRGPTALGLTSAVPRGTTVLDFVIEGSAVVVNFSHRLTAQGLDEARAQAIFEQVKNTLWYYGVEGDLSVLANGIPFADYLPETAEVAPGAEALAPYANAIASLGGRSVFLSPGHGLFWNGSGWYTARPVYCSPLNQEDYHNLEMMRYLQAHLAADAATVKLARCTNLGQGASPYNGGEAWWHMGASYWLKNLGYPCSVYASSTGDCNLGSGGTETNDDIRARPLASDYDNTNIYISLHTNGLSGDCYGSGCPTGTITYYDCGTEHSSWCTVSQNLANSVHDSLISAIRTYYDGSWTDRGKANSNGAYGEIRIPDRAAILIELGFHDTCEKDAVYLRDNWFRSVSMWGIYNGICSYFGTAPTWGFYSSEVVSNTIPSTMAPGETKSVSVTMRNRGVLWNSARGYKLGAVGDSDPFTGTTRQLLSSEVEPSGTVTFTFNLTAPTTPGTYTTDWRMVREGVTWFGATCSKTITVSSPVVEVILDNAQAGFTASANWSTGTSSTDKYGADYRFRSTQAISDAATWAVTLPAAGSYQVYAWWPQGTNRSLTAPYIVYYSGGSQTINVNQQINGGKWNLLTTQSMAAGSNQVKLSCWTTLGKVVMADAVRWYKP